LPSALIIGSGPAAAGAALALSSHGDQQITVIDIGLQLELDHRRDADALAGLRPNEWTPEMVQAVAIGPMASSTGGLPQKRTYGSDYPFRDLGQLDGISAVDRANPAVVSPAYGGFSTIWGAQVMPFPAAVFDRWPVRMDEMEPHYRAVLAAIPFAAEEDDLAAMFPLIGPAQPLPPVAERTARVLSRYQRHQRRLRDLGITLGKARLAFAAASCVRCGLCMSGCPYQLIYSAAQTFDALREKRRLTYRGGLLALSLEEADGRARVNAMELSTRRVQQFSADRVYVAAGGIGSTRLVANSAGLFGSEITMQESQQFGIPFLSLHGVQDPRHEPLFTLNQFNMTVGMDERGLDLSQLHFYTYNAAFIGGFPAPLRAGIAEPARAALLRRLTFALGYLPSWRSPAIHLSVGPPADGQLPALRVSAASARGTRDPMLRRVMGKVLRAAALLDLYPVVPMLRRAAAGKSYHFGGTFPHAPHGPTLATSDRLGRIGDWQRIHLVDASVFPSVPATTFTLTIMANAHRIATESMDLPQ
jgi:choline dehydrogenase-like flavoprotein